MESQRSILIIGFLLVSFFLFLEYQEASSPQAQQQAAQEEAIANQSLLDLDTIVRNEPGSELSNGAPSNLSTATGASDVPTDIEESEATPIAETLTNTSRFVDVRTDTLHVKIDLQGGDVVQADLIQYPVTQGADDSYELLSPRNATLYIAQSGLAGTNGIDNAQGRAIYQSPSDAYVMQGQDTLRVPLIYTNADGLKVTKTFVFESDSHTVQVVYDIENNTSTPLQMRQYAQLKQTLNDQSSGSMFMPTFRGAAYSTQDERYEKLPFDDMEDGLRVATLGGWVGMLEHYFVSAWVPPQEETNTIRARLSGNNAIIEFIGENKLINAGETQQISTHLYAGPKDQAVLAELARGLDLTVDYGFLWWLAQPLFDLLKLIQSFVINWGLAIIIITLIVKGAMYWLTKKQYESMAKMRNLAPKMQQLKDRYGDDRQKMSQAMMEMYKKEKVNPMGGCFPLLLQMPIFLALYWVLLESVELRHAGFVLWITDLSVPDPYFVLPILTGASMYLLQKLQPMTIQDPLQQKLLQYMPVAMSIFFFFFPAGLVLYWLVSNLVTLVQAKMIYASMEKRGIKSR
uniref:membrane protein insertase YidC n=1 Tax=Ningiella ruwaisensis TaxID=2364274 RepID=UPI00109F9F1A|nr:membrane protein insertase YidC [Ningiella ruwaisensis]